MRYSAHSSTSRVLALAGAAVLASGCSFITGVPSVERVKVTIAQPVIAAGGQGTAVIGEAFDGDGGLVTHRRRIVNFRSSNAAVATVAGTGTGGTVLGISAGTAWIVGESDGKRDSAMVTVTPRQPNEIQLDPAFPRIPVGATVNAAVRALGPTGQPFEGGYTVACQSSTPTVLGATASGTNCALTGIAQGTAVLRVTVNGGTTRDFQVIVENEVPARVIPRVRTPLRQTEQVNVDVELQRANNSVIPSAGRTYAYASSNNAVISVNANGVLTAVGEGTATLTVTAGTVSGTQQITVTKIPVVEVVLPTNPTYRVGALNNLQVAALDSLNRTLPLAGRLVTYTSSDTTVLRINRTTGLIDPLRPGTATLTARIDSITRSTSATVTPIPVGLVRIDSNLVERNPGGTFQYTAQVLDSLGRRLTDRPIRWASSNSSIVSINSSTGLARAEQPGQVRITAIAERVPGQPGEVTGEGTFTVFSAPVARLEVSPSTASVRAGSNTLVLVTARDAAGNQLFGRTIVGTSTNPAVAASGGVSSTGEATIRGISSGTATIRYQALSSGGQPQGDPVDVQVSVSASAVNVTRIPARP